MSNASVYFILHVQLEPLHLSPPIWRRLLVSGDCTLRKLHHFIQAAMGWHSSHLHEFNDGLHRSCHRVPISRISSRGTTASTSCTVGSRKAAVCAMSTTSAIPGST